MCPFAMEISPIINLPLMVLIISALLSLGLPAKGGLPSTGRERHIYQTFQNESGTCMGYYKKDLVQIDINASKGSTVAVVWAAGCGRRCTLTIIGGPPAVGACVSRCAAGLAAQLAFIVGIAVSERSDSGKERDKCVAIARSKRDQALVNNTPNIN